MVFSGNDLGPINSHIDDLAATFANGHSIIVANPGTDLAWLHAALRSGPQGTLQEDVLVYALNREPNGDYWQLTIYDAPKSANVGRATAR